MTSESIECTLHSHDWLLLDDYDRDPDVPRGKYLECKHCGAECFDAAVINRARMERAREIAEAMQ